MNRYVIYVVLGLTLSACQKKEAAPLAPARTVQTLNAAEFKKAPLKKQAESFNALSVAERMAFLKAILPGMTWEVQPNEEALFLENGDFVFDPNTEKYFVGHWRVEGDRLILSRGSTQKEINFIDEKTELTNARADYYASQNMTPSESLDFVFDVVGKPNVTRNMGFMEHDPAQWDDAMKFYNSRPKQK